MEFDGRGLAIGIGLGTLVGLVVMLITGSALYIGAFAALGAILGLNTGWFKRDQ